MDSLTIGHSGRTVTFGRTNATASADPYAGAQFPVTLTGSGLTATCSVFVFGFSGLDLYFADLASNWRGWSGSKRWESPEGHLNIGASHTGVGDVQLTVTLHDGSVHAWRASIAIEVEPGEELCSVSGQLAILMTPRE